MRVKNLLFKNLQRGPADLFEADLDLAENIYL